MSIILSPSAFAVQPYTDGDYADYVAYLAAQGEHHDQDAAMECGFTDFDPNDSAEVDAYLEARGYDADGRSGMPDEFFMFGGYPT